VTSWSSWSERRAPRARRLGPRDRAEACARLARRRRENLLLLELAAHLGLAPGPGEMRAELLGVWEEGELAGVAAVRPSILLDAGMPPAALEAVLPHLQGVAAGLIKSHPSLVAPCWARLSARGRRALVDRAETACAVDPGQASLEGVPAGLAIRPAREEDLPALVEAARASLREEGRPDPFDGDPEGFRRWVRGRASRATVVEEAHGRIAFVGYADVQRPEGWLLQGVYTWPARRRRGLGAVGVSALCRSAFRAGADHVQLSLVDGNLAAERLYARLGFTPFARLRTILFA